MQEMEKGEGRADDDVEETSGERREEAPLLGGGGDGGTAAFKRGVAILDLILRISAATAAMAATITMGTTEQTLPFFTQLLQFRASYEDLPAFTFFVIALSVSSGYLVLSVPFSVVCISQPLVVGPKLLLIFCDTLTVTMGTAAVASSAGMVYLAHEGSSDARWLPICLQFEDFCRRISGAVVAGFVAEALLLVMVMLSALSLRKP